MDNLLIEEASISDSTIEFSFQDNQLICCFDTPFESSCQNNKTLSIYIDNPWVGRGDDDDGLGESAEIELNAEQVKELFFWLQGVIRDDGHESKSDGERLQ